MSYENRLKRHGRAHQKTIGVLDADNLGQPVLLCQLDEPHHSVRCLVRHPNVAHLQSERSVFDFRPLTKLLSLCAKPHCQP